MFVLARPGLRRIRGYSRALFACGEYEHVCVCVRKHIGGYEGVGQREHVDELNLGYINNLIYNTI